MKIYTREELDSVLHGCDHAISRLSGKCPKLIIEGLRIAKAMAQEQLAINEAEENLWDDFE